MELPLFVTYIIPILIFGPIYFRYYRKNEDLSEIRKLLILGGFGWSLLALGALIPFSFILESSTEKRYLEIFGSDSTRTPLFWLLVIFSIGSEVIKYFIVSREKVWIGNYRSLAMFGTFWGIFEFLSRFLLFGSDLIFVVFLFIYIVLLNLGLAMIILRTEENSKFVMFSSIMRFFGELAIFGAFGHILSEGERLGRLSYVIILHIVIVYLSVITRKPVNLSNPVAS